MLQRVWLGTANATKRQGVAALQLDAYYLFSVVW